MSFQLNFNHREKYSSLETGITVKTTLRYGELFINSDAKIDTGATVCLFQRIVGETLEIPIENGIPKRLETLTGVLTAYGHEIVLETCGL